MSGTPALDKFERFMKANLGNLIIDRCDCGTPKKDFKKGEEVTYGSNQKCPCSKEYVEINTRGIYFGVIPKKKYEKLAYSTPDHRGSLFGEIEDLCFT